MAKNCGSRSSSNGYEGGRELSEEAEQFMAPATPISNQLNSFQNVVTANSVLTSVNGTIISRRPSMTTCSSSSSLYEGTVGGEAGGNATGSGGCSSESDSDVDSDFEISKSHDVSAIRRSHELFRLQVDHSAGSTSGSSSIKKKNEYFMSPKESTPIFKRLVSKSSLKPQLKSFKRITTELQFESIPLHNEINHEKLTLMSLNSEVITGTSSLLKEGFKESCSELSKFDIIKKANESWNKRNVVESGASTSGSREKSRKRSIDEGSSSKLKRRAVSSSPISSPIGSPHLLKRENTRLMFSASNDLEKMSLD